MMEFDLPYVTDNRFEALQEAFIDQYAEVFNDPLAPRAVVVIPSLTLDQEILSSVKGHCYYEERMLCLLLLLKMPDTFLTFVTSVPIAPIIIDYYLHMLPGIIGDHARKRLTLLSCYDAGNIPLTEKILTRPRLMQRIKKSIPAEYPAHLVFFNVTGLEKELAVRLNMPIYGCNPALNYLGTKSGSRTIFKELNILLPEGTEDLKNENDIVKALYQLKVVKPDLHKAVIKINDGFSGDGNAIFYFDGAPADSSLLEFWIQENLRAKTKIVAENVRYDQYVEKFGSLGGIVEEFIVGEIITSPSVQCRINPLGEICIISTHDQCLGGESGQVFLGATFPANKEYAVELGSICRKIAEKMSALGVLGRFGIDFMSVLKDNTWTHYALETNLRKGGTTHPYLMLQFLTNGTYDESKGSFILSDGTERFYFATDNLQNDQYKGLTPLDLIDIAMYNGLHYDHSKEEGVMFHLISALSEFGKLGLVSIGKTMESANDYYNRVLDVLNKETKT